MIKSTLYSSIFRATSTQSALYKHVVVALFIVFYCMIFSMMAVVLLLFDL